MLLSGLIGALIATLLNVLYNYIFTEKKIRSDVSIAIEIKVVFMDSD